MACSSEGPTGLPCVDIPWTVRVPDVTNNAHEPK
jgi:hypothetical protein